MEQPQILNSKVERIVYPPNKRLNRMRFLSRLLDNSILLPGGMRIGIDPLIGLLPGIGDFLGALLSLSIVYDAARLGVRKRAIGQMLGNVVIDTAISSFPVAGDLFDAAWKANARNLRLVELEYSPVMKERPARAIFVFFAFLFLLLFLGAFSFTVFIYKMLFSLFH